MKLRDIADTSLASQDPQEMFQLMSVVRRIKPKVILEIGVDKGYSLLAWQQAFHPELMIGIDDNRQSELERRAHQDLDVDLCYMDSHKPETLEYVKGFLKKRKVDFLFIDGDHTYEGVKKDYEMYSPLVKRDGVIAFHDSMRTGPEWDGKIGVHQFVSELMQDHTGQTFFNIEAEDAPGTSYIWK